MKLQGQFSQITEEIFCHFLVLCGQILHLSMFISYHGLGVWFPDMIKYMQYEEYESKVRVFHRERVEHFHFNFSLVNQIHQEGEYIHDK